VIAVMVAAQGLWRRQRQCSDCSVGIGAVIVASALVSAVIVAAALVGAVIVAAAALVGAVIVVAASAQLLQGSRRSYCGGSVGAVIAVMVVFVQGLWRRQHQCSGCSCGVGTMIAAISLVGSVIAVTAALVQRLQQRGWLATALIAAATALAQGLATVLAQGLR
jgi:hypothetical protein